MLIGKKIVAEKRRILWINEKRFTEKRGSLLIDNERFTEVCNFIINREKNDRRIGTLGEKTVHAVLKYYLERNETLHEQKLISYYADIARKLDNDRIEIIEIQTGNFNVLRKKLDCFLTFANVTIVYPIPYKKWIFWIDEETGEVTKKRKSPKIGSFYMVFPELYKIKTYLKNPNLNIQLLLIDMEEYRLLNGWSKDKKKGSSRYDRIPIVLAEELILQSAEDYEVFISKDLPEEFTSKEFQKVSKLTLSKAQTALNILYYMGVVERVGKRGNSYIYRRTFT